MTDDNANLEIRIPTKNELGFDIADIRAKYEEERVKRLETGGIDQFKEVRGPFRRYDDDPYVEPGFTREPVEEEVDVLVAGGGFGGLIAAKGLQDADITNFRIIERAGDFGGVWYWNRYPGAQCDIDAYVYLPLLEETGYIPKEKYAFQPEIFRHAQRIGETFGLYDKTLFQTAIREIRWNEDTADWKITTDRNDQIKARFVFLNSGPMNHPQLPGIDGIEKFQGEIFHTSRWNYGYTGGNTSGGMHKLHDKKVAVIGTGATAIQCVPMLARDAEHLYVVQRTPSSVEARGNKPTDPEWIKTLKPGWYTERNENFAQILAGIPVEEDLVNDSWTRLFKVFGDTTVILEKGASLEVATQIAEISDAQTMNRLRDRIDFIVEDKQIAEKLKPWYGVFCKRPTFNDHYLPAFNRPNVTLVDTDGKGVKVMSERGLIIDGEEIKVDCIIFATGFETSTSQTNKSACQIYGRDGLALSECWADGMKSLYGQMAHGFPNCFHTGFRQASFVPNFIYLLEREVENVVHIIRETMNREAKSVEPTQQAESDWVELTHTPTYLSEYLLSCTPGYYNSNGQYDVRSFMQELYPYGPIAFFNLLKEWRANGKLEGLEFR